MPDPCGLTADRPQHSAGLHQVDKPAFKPFACARLFGRAGRSPQAGPSKGVSERGRRAADRPLSPLLSMSTATPRRPTTPCGWRGSRPIPRPRPRAERPPHRRPFHLVAQAWGAPPSGQAGDVEHADHRLGRVIGLAVDRPGRALQLATTSSKLRVRPVCG